MDAIILDLERRQAIVDGRAVVLGARVFELFRALLAQEGAIVSKDDLIAAAWGGVHVEENNLQVQAAWDRASTSSWASEPAARRAAPRGNW